MKLIEKILVGTDFSESSKIAVEQAMHVSKQFGSSVILVHVIPEMNMSDLNEVMIRDAVSKEMQTISEQLTEEDISVKTIIEKGIPFIQLMKIAELQDVNVILVGSGSNQSQRLGITAEKLMSKSIKPVWVVPAGIKSEFQKVLCAVDFSDTSKRALENAIHLSRQYDVELNVLHVIEQRSLSVIEKRLGISSEKKSDKSRYQKQFDSYLEQFDFYNVRWNKILSEGSPAEEIIHQAQKADLLLMGSVGQSVHPKMLSGSTARSIFRLLPAAIISFKSDNIIQLKLENELREIESRFQQGIELLENGFINESIAQFKYCLSEDPLFAPAWELLADAYFRIGNEQKAQEHQAKASEIREKLWSQKVEADIKRRHTLYKSNERVV